MLTKTKTRMRLLVYYLTVILIQCKTLNSAQLEAEILPPLVYNTYLNSQKYGTFTCVTRNSNNVHWIVNGVAHNNPSVRNARKIRVEETADDHSVVMIPAIPINHRISEIRCRAYILDEEYQEVARNESREIAQFNIQGLLDMPPNISYSSYNVTHNLLVWQEPETLNITDIEPDVENYTVCNTIINQCAVTTRTNFILPKYTLDFFVNVTAWNIVGKSNSSAQLLIEACNATMKTTDQRYLVEISFKKRNLTFMHITFINDHFIKAHNSSSSSGDHEECLYLYEINILSRSTQSTLFTHQIYGNLYSIILRLKLTRNRLYTVEIKRIASSTHLSLNAVNFSTYDVQDLRVRFANTEQNVLQITCHLAAGAITKGFTIYLVRENQTLLQASFNTSNECGQAPILQSCAVNKSVKFSHFGNFTLFVLDWEQNLSITSNVHLLGNMYSATLRSASTDTITQETTYTPSAVLITSAATIGGSILGIGAVCLVCLLVAAIISKGVKHKDSRSSQVSLPEINFNNPQVVPNEAYTYSATLHMKVNEAYETTLKEQINIEPHLYDEIDVFPVVSNSDPVYAEIGKQA